MTRELSGTQIPSRQQYIAVIADCAVGGTLLYAIAAYALSVPRYVAFLIVILSALAGAARLIPLIRGARFRPARGGSLLYAPVSLTMWIATAGAFFTLFALSAHDLYGMTLGFAVTSASALLGKVVAKNSSLQ